MESRLTLFIVHISSLILHENNGQLLTLHWELMVTCSWLPIFLKLTLAFFFPSLKLSNVIDVAANMGILVSDELYATSGKVWKQHKIMYQSVCLSNILTIDVPDEVIVQKHAGRTKLSIYLFIHQLFTLCIYRFNFISHSYWGLERPLFTLKNRHEKYTLTFF